MCVSVVWGETATHQDEAKSDAYGLATDGDVIAIMRVYRLDANGHLIYWGSAEEGILATDLLGVTAEDIVSGLSYMQNGQYVPMRIATHNGQPVSTTAGANTTSPFWGVWIGASKDAGEAQAIADEAKAAGLPGLVFFTTDWDNLNSEPWYVISVGASASESEAYALRDRAVNAGYGDAYVKYSGNHR